MKRLALLLLMIILLCGAYWHNVKMPQRESENFADFMNQYYINKTASYEDENKTLGEVDVAFIGDSLTDGYDLAAYYPDLAVINRGIGGDTTHGVLARLEVSVVIPEPKVIVMMIGTNNIDDMFTDYEDIIVEMKKALPETKIVVLSVTPVTAADPTRNGKIALANVKIEALAEKHGITYVDMFTPLYDLETEGLRAEYTTDGLHFTPLGYEVITATVRPIIDALLAE